MTLDNSQNESIPSHFLIYWVGQLFSLTGSEITQFAIIWWIAIAYESPFIFSLGLFAGNITRIFMMPIIGIITDVENRKQVLILADFGQALITLGLIYFFLQNQITLPLLLILLAARDMFQNIHENTSSAIVPQIVPKEIFSRLNGMNLLSFGISALGGPLIGALFIELFGMENIAYVLLIDLFSFAFAFLTVIFLNIPLNLNPKNKEQRFVDKLTFGFRFISKRKIMVLLVSLPTISNFTLTASHIVMPIYLLSSDQFNAGARGLSIAIAIQSLGYILATIFTSLRKITDNFYNRNYLSYVLWIIGVGFTAYGLYITNFMILLVGQFLTGFWIAYVSTVNATIWQRIVPTADIGKVAAIRRMFVAGSYPVGLVLVGYFSNLIDPVLLVAFGAIIALIYILIAFTFSSLKLVDETIQNAKID